MSRSTEVPYPCFISYRRDDNEAFGAVVDRLRTDIQALFEAQTGKTLNVFLDRESIGWGETWRDKINESVTAATLFLPVITMRYFNSSACRDELWAFAEAARRRGLTDLVLPIVLMGSDQLSADSDSPEIQLIESLKPISIHDEWLAGYESPEWRKVTHRIVTGLKDALVRAEAQLEVEAADNPLTRAIEATDVEEFADFGQLLESTNKLVGDLDSFKQAFEAFGNAANERIGDRNLSTLSPGQQNALFLSLASDLKEPGRLVEVTGQEIEQTAVRIDAQLRALVADLADNNFPGIPDQLATIYLQARALAIELAGFDGMVSNMLDALKLMAMMNSTLRKSVNPVTRGVRSVSVAVGIIRSWASLDTK